MAGRINNKSSNLPITEQLSYDPLTGIFTWAISKSKITKGSRAGGITEKGYRKIKINGKKYFEHRLAFYFMIGKWPEDQVDHKNNKRDDNRWGNLRQANNSQNQWNSKPYSNTGVKGVYKRGKRFRVKGHQDIHLCTVDDFELACLISQEHREASQGGFTRVR